MTFTLNTTQKSVSAQFTDAEWTVLTYARTTHGNGVIQDLLKNWLRSMWRQSEDERLKALEAPVPTELT